MLAELEVCITTSGSCAKGNPLLITLLPAVIGALLGIAGTVFLRRGERAWQRERERFSRDVEMARPLDATLTQVQLWVSGTRREEDMSRWDGAYRAWVEGGAMSSMQLSEAELETRYIAVGSILTEIADREHDDDFKRGLAIQVANRAITNARQALGYWLRGDPLPPASFPSTPELIKLLNEGGEKPLAKDSPLWAWLNEHPVPPWRPEPKPGRRLGRRGHC